MISNKTKSENESPLRTPKAKNKLGLKIPKIALPHDDLIGAEKPKLEIVSAQNEHSNTMPSRTTQTSHTTRTSQPQKANKNEIEIAPTKNYQKVPNSIAKQAIPEGFFKGKDKHLYDVLYSLTRGAIEPKRKVRVSKTKLMKLSGIGARITFDACIERLIQVGLLKLRVFTGEHEGNEFEIFLPEEIANPITLTSHSSLTSQTTMTSPAQKQDTLVSLETSQTSQSLNQVDASIYGTTKTFFKDSNTNDDDETAFAAMEKTLSDICRKLTGKPPTKAQKENWNELAQVLAMELEIAAARSSSISNVPAFLTEHLRRRLLHKPESRALANKTFSAKGVSKSLEVGKAINTEEINVQDYQAEPLTEEGRETVLKTMNEYIEKGEKEFVLNLRDTYTTQDWQWLSERLIKTEDKKQESGEDKHNQ